jgi:tetratricopeptide (TPR) repeat protein
MRWGIRWFIRFAAIAALAGAHAAHAQITPPPSTASASLPSAPTNDAKARAQEHLDRGNALKNERFFDKALVEFRAAHDLYPSPKILYNEADTESELGHFVDAAAHYDAFLREFQEPQDDEDAQRIQAAKEGAVAARAKIAILDPVVAGGVEVLVDAHSFGKAPLVEPVHIDPGRHRVTFRRAGLADSNRDVVLSPGERLRLPDLALLTLSRPPPPPPPSRPLWRRWPFWAAVGVAAVVGGVAAIYVSNRSDRPPCKVAFCVQGD